MDIIDFIAQSFNQVVDWINSGLTAYITEFLAFLYIQLFKLWLTGKIFFATVAFNVFLEVLQQIDISGPINNALSGTDSFFRYLVARSHILEGLNIILSAYITKMGMRATGF